MKQLRQQRQLRVAQQAFSTTNNGVIGTINDRHDLMSSYDAQQYKSYLDLLFQQHQQSNQRQSLRANPDSSILGYMNVKNEQNCFKIE